MSLHPALPDTLYLWHLGQPEAPRVVGTLNLVMNRRGVSLRYADAWLKDGFALSEDLPLTDIEHFPRDKDSAAGAVDDARPDRWGERVIRLLDRPPAGACMRSRPRWPCAPSLGYQAMEVGERGAESSIDNALSACAQYWLSPQAAQDEARRVAEVVDGWRAHFVAQGVGEADLDELGRHIDRPFLREQRQALQSRAARAQTPR